MRKFYTILLGAIVALICLSENAQAQNDGKIKLKITREIDGERKILDKEYTSEEEMRADPEYQAMMGEDDINFSFSGDKENTIVMKMRKMDDGNDQGFFFFNGDDDDSHVRIFDDEMIEEEMKEIQLELKRHLHDSKTEDEMKRIDLTLKNLEDADHKYLYIVKSRKVKVADVEGDEFGKKGRVAKSDQLQLDDLEFFPNPSNGRFRLQFNIPGEDELSITVFNLEGQSVFSSYYGKFSGVYRETIDLTNRDPGIYLLEVAIGNKRLTRKIIVDQ